MATLHPNAGTTKILLVEDDKDLTTIVQIWLESQGHLVEIVHDGEEGLERLRSSNYDVAILDLELPGMSGMQILSTFRGEQGTTPVLILTGRSDIEDIVIGLDVGADDYLTKPFNMKELCSRVRAMLRRTQPEQRNLLQVGQLVCDRTKHKVTRGGVEILLAPREFALLEFLMRNEDNVFSWEALIEKVWHSDSDATAEAIRTSIKRLRQKLGDDGAESIIENIPRVGYRLRSCWHE